MQLRIVLRDMDLSLLPRKPLISHLPGWSDQDQDTCFLDSKLFLKMCVSALQFLSCFQTLFDQTPPVGVVLPILIVQGPILFADTCQTHLLLKLRPFITGFTLLPSAATAHPNKFVASVLLL